MGKPRILLVDDEPHIADVVVYMLEEHGFAVETAQTGRQGLERFRSRRPDLVILDLNLPEISGFDVFREMKQLAPAIPVIMLTCRSDEVDRVLGLELGADDYVTKPFSARELTARVKTVLRRAQHGADPAATVIRYGPLTLYPADHRLEYFDTPVVMTRAEFELIRALVSHPARVFERDALISRIYEPNHPVTDRTIDAYVKRIRQKLQKINRQVDPITTVYGLGYKLNDRLDAMPGEESAAP
ncbi:MAG: response regulator [Spartobacteria bacterium]|nr:response regulator [Spartobacteria bacterium]